MTPQNDTNTRVLNKQMRKIMSETGLRILRRPGRAVLVYLTLPAIIAWVFSPLFAQTPLNYPYATAYAVFWAKGLWRVYREATN